MAMSRTLSRPTLPYVVLDQSVLRDELRIGSLIDRAKGYRELLLLPDIALFEMMQNDQWEETVRSSLKALSRFPAGVVVAHAPGELLRQERETGEPRLDIVDHETTPWLRRLLADIQIGASRLMDDLRERLPEARRAFQEQQRDHERNKERVRRMEDAWKALLGPDLQKLVRRQSDRERDKFRSLMANGRFHERVIRDALVREGFSEAVASGPSVTAWQFFCFAGLALDWVSWGGLDSRAPEKVSHDLADLDYILLALFCRGGLVSNDGVKKRGQVELYEDLSASLDRVEAMRADAQLAVERRDDLKARARSVTETLVRKYGATRVVLFGSVARDGDRIPGDIDLYVEGLHPQQWVDACCDADAIAGDIRVDLVTAESAAPFVRKTVEAEGLTLYETAHG